MQQYDGYDFLDEASHRFSDECRRLGEKWANSQGFSFSPALAKLAIMVVLESKPTWLDGLKIEGEGCDNPTMP